MRGNTKLHLLTICSLAILWPGCRCATGGEARGGTDLAGDHIRVLDEVELENGGGLALVGIGDRTVLVGTNQNQPPSMLGDVDPSSLGYELAAGEAPAGADDASGDAWTEGNLAAQRSEPEGEPRNGGEIVVQVGSNPPSLNTIVHSDWLASRVTKPHIYESLVGVDPYDHPNYRHQPALAERWEISEDNLVYTFYLRRGVT